MEALKKLTKELLPYQSISGRAKSMFFAKLERFNTKYGSKFYVDFAPEGNSDNHLWLLIRQGGPHGEIIKERRFKDPRKKSMFEKTIERLQRKTSVQYKLAI